MTNGDKLFAMLVDPSDKNHKIVFPVKSFNTKPSYAGYEIGSFITDGKQVYVLGRDLEWHYCDSGNHANFHVSHKELKALVGDNYCK